MSSMIRQLTVNVAPFLPAKIRPMLPLLGALIALLAVSVASADDAGCCG